MEIHKKIHFGWFTFQQINLLVNRSNSLNGMGQEYIIATWKRSSDLQMPTTDISCFECEARVSILHTVVPFSLEIKGLKFVFIEQ